MPSLEEIIWALNAGLLGWILRQYFQLRKEINQINIALTKNETLGESIKRLFENNEKVLEAIQEIRIDQATMFERIERYHEDGAKKKRETLHAEYSE